MNARWNLLRWRRVLTLMLGVLSAAQAHAELITLTDAQVDHLGITLARPQLAERHSAGVEASAVVEVPPDRQYLLGPMFAGVVSRLSVMPGESVSSGQPIAQVMSADFLKAQQAFVEVKIRQSLLRAHLARDESLFADGTVSARRLQETRAEASTADAQYHASERMLRLAGLTDEDIHGLVRNHTLQDALQLRAKADGIVLEVLTDNGESVDALMPVYRLADPSLLWLNIQLPVSAAVSVHPGVRFELVDGPPGVSGLVLAVGRAVQAGTQTVTVRGQVDSGSERLSPGQFVTVAFQQHGDAWQVPSAAVASDGVRSVVFVRTDAGFAPLSVMVEVEDRSESVIRGDLADMPRVAVSGITALKALWLEATGEED